MQLAVAVVRRNDASVGESQWLKRGAFAKQQQHLALLHIECTKAIVTHHPVKSEEFLIEEDGTVDVLHVQCRFQKAHADYLARRFRSCISSRDGKRSANS